MVYILNLKAPASFIIQYIFSLYQGLNLGPSDPEADDIPMCHHASPSRRCYSRSGWEIEPGSSRVVASVLTITPWQIYMHWFYFYHSYRVNFWMQLLTNKPA